MNRNLSPDEFGDLFLDIGPDAGQTFETKADIDAREAAGMPGIFEGIAGAEMERRSVEQVIRGTDMDLIERMMFENDFSEPDDTPDRRWTPPPGRTN